MKTLGTLTVDIHQLISDIRKFTSTYIALKNKIFVDAGIVKRAKKTVSKSALAKVSVTKIRDQNAKIAADINPEIIKLTKFLESLEQKLCDSALQRRDYLNLYIKIVTEIISLDKKISSLKTSLYSVHEKDLIEKNQLEMILLEKLLQAYQKLETAFIEIFDTFNTTDIVKKVDSLYKNKYLELENNRNKDILIWESLQQTLTTLIEEAQKQQEHEQGLFNSINDEALLQKNPLTPIEISNIRELETYFYNRKTLQKKPPGKFVEEVILSNLRQLMRTEQLCKDFNVNFLNYFHNKSTVEDNLLPFCTGVVFDFGKRVHQDREYSLGKKQSNFLQTMSSVFEILRADKFPPDLMLDKFFQGDQIISPEIIWCRNQLPKFLPISGRASIIKGASKDNPLRCEGNQIVLDCMQMLNNPSASPRLVEITLSTVHKQYPAHTIGMAKVSTPVPSLSGKVSVKDRYYLINSHMGEFSCDCPKQFAEWMQQHFQMIRYNIFYNGYTIRSIDKAIAMILKPGTSRIEQEKALAQKSAFILANYRLHLVKNSNIKSKLSPKVNIKQVENAVVAKDTKPKPVSKY